MARINRTGFFSSVKTIFTNGYNGPDGKGRIQGLDTLIDEWEKKPHISHKQFAYILATAAWETAYTMQPIKEKGGNAYFKKMYDITGSRKKVAERLGNIHEGDGVKYAGRGYVQLTGRTNYVKAGQKLEVNLETSPDLAMKPEIAVQILFVGMEEGWFTGKKLTTYINDKQTDYVNARRIINGTDKAEQIASIAKRFEEALAKYEIANPYPISTSRTTIGSLAPAAGGTAILLDATNTVVSNVEAQREAFTSGSIAQIVIGLIVLGGALVALYAQWDDAGRPKFWKRGV